MTDGPDQDIAQDIAIVGRACRLPGAASVAELWTLLESGTCAVTKVPADRWSHERFGHPRIAERGRSYTWAAGCLDDIWGFDPGAFGMSPREAEMIDPQQRLLLELTWEAFEDAGIRPSTMAGSDAGVFVGVSAVDHSTLHLLDMSSADAYMMTGNTLSVVANRISYIFDLHGPSFVVDTACSSSLVALNEAIVHLRSGRIGTAIVAGVGILGAPQSYIGFSQAAMLSRRGLCQAFSADADGYVRAEGGVVLVLQTRAAAERAGHPIHALIAATGVNSDGRTNGISLPSKQFQANLLDGLYRRNGIDPNDLAFFEAHGTGTPVGDPIEAGAIGETLARHRREPLPMGSIKTNIGHMEAASGLGGLLKASLALEHDALPPSLHSAELNPDIDFGGLNLDVVQSLTPLPRRPGRRRLAGVNSFGFGGTNAHAVLADAPPAASPGVTAPPPFFVVSAHSRPALTALAAVYAERLDATDDREGDAIMAAAVHRRDLLAHRIVVPVANRTQVVAALDGFRDEGGDVVGAARATAVEREAPVAFVFSGNGSQFAGMGLAAYARNAMFRARLDEVSSAFERLAGWSIVDVLHGDDLEAKLDLTEYAQPLLFALQHAIGWTLRACGIEPSWMIGHSVGEVAAAEAAGILDLKSALQTIFARSRHQRATAGKGGMAVVIGSGEVTDEILADLPNLCVAARNSPRAFTIAGPKDEIERLSSVVREARARVRPLALNYPFHSPLMAPVEKPLLRSLAGLKPRPATVTFLSTVTGGALDGEHLDNRYWWRNVREPVLFADAVREAVRLGARVFVEIGPNPTLLSHIADTVDERSARIATLPSLEKRDHGDDPIAAAIAAAIARGAKFDRTKAFGPPPAAGSRVALPLYPWQRTTFRLGGTSESASNLAPSPWHPLIGARYQSDRLEWFSTLDTALLPSLADHCVEGRAILPGAGFAEMALAVARDWLGCDALTITDLDITSPLQLASDASREVLCRLSPLVGHIDIMSRPRLGQIPWQTHATAKLLRDPAIGTLADRRRDPPDAPPRSIDGADIYAIAERSGLRYGPTFRLLKSAAIVAPDHIEIELAPSTSDPAFGLDPARLDACFHALVLVFAGVGGEDDAHHATPYVPVRFGEVALRLPGRTFIRGRVDILRRDERIIVANFTLTDEDDNLVLYVREARFQAVRTSRAIDGARKIVRQRTILASEPTAARRDRPLTLAALRRGLPAAATATEMSDDFVLLEGWATSLALQTARDVATGDVVDLRALVETGRIRDATRPWFEALLHALERSGLGHKTRHGWRIDPSAHLPPAADILRAVALEHQSLSAELLVAAATMTAVRAVLAGEADTPGPTLPPKVRDALDLGSSEAKAAAHRLIEIVEASRKSWPKDRAMRVLQIGFGPLTVGALRLCDEAQARLTIFDPDRRRLERARMSFADRGDIDMIGGVDELPAASFDLVLASHVLHRHRSVSGFCLGLRQAMAQGALFVAIEPAPSLFRDMALGLDACLGEGDVARGLSASEADWVATLRAMSLGAAHATPIDIDGTAALVLTGHVEAERRSWSGSGNALLIGGGDDAATSAFATLISSSGVHVTLLGDNELDDPHLVETPAFAVVFIQADDAHVAPAVGLTRQCMGLKRLAAKLGQRKLTLWLVTSGALEPVAESRCDIAAGVWAFSRTLANEMPNLDIRRVDIAPDLRPDGTADRLRDLVLSGTDETEIRLERETTRVVRFESGSSVARDRGTPAEAAQLQRGEGSGIDRLHWHPVERRTPKAHEVEIAVEAVGLNFRDVMFGLGLLPEDILEHGFAGPTLGLECAGRIVRVGTAVKTLTPGQRVMAFAKNAFATHTTTAAAVVAPIADALSFDMAATIPVAFLTAYHALMSCARLKPKEWVLIHGGAGGVGLAAIQIARWRGARVIATAGSPERRALLVALGADHAFDSRSGAFVDDVRRVTGTGVGVVLNSLSGEAMERSIGVLRPFGRFVELGKRDYVANTHVGLRPFRRNLSYFGVDLDQLLIDEPATSRRLMRAVTRLFASGNLVPLPYRVFEAAETVDAFRLMQQSGHVGKLVIRPPPLAGMVKNDPRAFEVSPDKTHVVSGGFGGFGLQTALWLAAKGARHLTLIGRSGPASDEARDAIATLQARGVSVQAERLDIADRAALQALFARFANDLPPLGGVVHAAMVLDDAMIANMSAEQMQRVLRPKIAGADNLDQLTRDLDLDYFVLFSSATTLIGNPGQAAYVAANGYLEGLARRRCRMGLPALAVAWGAIEDVGILARSDATRDALASRVGIKGMRAQDALAELEDVLGRPAAQVEDAVVTIAPFAWSAARQHLAILRTPAYRNLSSHDEAASDGKDKVDIAALVAGVPPEEGRKIVSGLIVDEIARVLRLPRDDIARTNPLAEIGLDSLMAVELALGLEERFVLNGPLPTTASGFSVNELADHIIGVATGTMSGDEASARHLLQRHLGEEAIGQLTEDKADFRQQAEAVTARSRAMKGVLN